MDNINNINFENNIENNEIESMSESMPESIPIELNYFNYQQKNHVLHLALSKNRPNADVIDEFSSILQAIEEDDSIRVLVLELFSDDALHLQNSENSENSENSKNSESLENPEATKSSESSENLNNIKNLNNLENLKGLEGLEGLENINEADLAAILKNLMPEIPDFNINNFNNINNDKKLKNILTYKLNDKNNKNNKNNEADENDELLIYQKNLYILLHKTLKNFSKIWVASIDACIEGHLLEWVMLADFIIASERTQLAYPQIDENVPILLSPRLKNLPPSILIEWCLEQKMLSAFSALHLQLLDKVFDLPDVWQKTEVFSQKIAEYPFTVLSFFKGQSNAARNI